MGNAAQELHKLGTSIWYDNISRDILKNGELKRIIAEWGVRGLTSNPTIFEKAIAASNTYDSQIAQLKSGGGTADEVLEELAVADIAEAADLLLPIYQDSAGIDGYVSIEVSPLLAADTRGTIEEGLRLFEKLRRPNIMIKVPGTPAGIPAVFELLSRGVNVNITLLFSVENYVEVAQTYIKALRARVEKGLAVDKLASVASFFVSRVDSIIDKKLGELVAQGGERATQAATLKGKFGIANCQLAYEKYQEIFEGPDFADLRAKGAQVQRPLWASTGTKDPAYSDVIYVDRLIGPNTVNTMPHATLAAFADHGTLKQTLGEDASGAKRILSELEDLGINVSQALHDLQVEGVSKFAESFTTLNAAIAKKL